MIFENTRGWIAVIILFLIVFGFGYKIVTAEPKKDYNWTFVVEVTYDTDGKTDVLELTRDSFKGNRVWLMDRTSAGTNCLILGCGFDGEEVICDVRKYTILDTIKTRPTQEWFKNRIRK